MAIAHVASTSAQGNSVNTNTTGAIDTTGANFLVVCIASNLGSSSFTSLTDSKSNTWQVALNWTSNSGDFIRIMYAENPTVGTGHTFSLNYSSSAFTVLCAAAYSGMATASTIDKTATGTGNSTSLLTSATATTAQSEELLIGTGTLSAGADSTFSAGTNYTIRTQQGFASSGAIGFLEDRIVAATGTYTASATWGGSSGVWVAGIATFKGASGGGGTVTGTGAVTLGAVTVAGTAEREITSTGAITLGTIVVSGAGAGTVSGTGAITLGPITVAGTGEREITDTGGAVDLSLPAITISGSGTVSGAGTVTGTGAITLGAVTVSGSGTRATNATGAITLGALQLAAQGLLVIDGTGAITLGAIQVSGFDVAPQTAERNAGGFIYAYQRELIRRKRERERRRELEEEAERIEEETTREIAQLLREQEAKDARRAELQRLSQLVDSYARRTAEAELSDRVQRAIDKVTSKGTTWALYALERELQRAIDEEEFVLKALQAFIEYEH